MHGKPKLASSQLQEERILGVCDDGNMELISKWNGKDLWIGDVSELGSDVRINLWPERVQHIADDRSSFIKAHRISSDSWMRCNFAKKKSLSDMQGITSAMGPGGSASKHKYFGTFSSIFSAKPNHDM